MWVMDHQAGAPGVRCVCLADLAHRRVLVAKEKDMSEQQPKCFPVVIFD
jgi:hypothetical protein